MAQRRIRIGVIGAGTFAEQCHIPGLQAHPDADVVALCGRTREKATAMATRFGIPDVHTDYQELIGRSDIDAVTVTTPDVSHYAVSMAALTAGKHIFCEKPLAMTVAEAQQMTDTVEHSGLVGMVSFTFRYTRALSELRRLIRTGAIGTPFHVAMQVYWGQVGTPNIPLTWRDQAIDSAAGIWADGGAHLFDALAFALAPVQEVCAQLMVVPRPQGTPQPDSADLATCLGRLALSAQTAPLTGYSDRQEGTVYLSMTTSRVSQSTRVLDEMQVSGTEGALSINLTRGNNERLRIHRTGNKAPEDLSLPDDATTNQPAALARMMGAFVDAVQRGHLDQDRDPGFAAGLHAQQALEAGLTSARSGRWEWVGR